ncbi:MAG: Eco57I restriction-modification methylase domain-containing protein [Chloroflexota bacterium]
MPYGSEDTKVAVQPPVQWFRNRGLFSDHFLRARLPEWPEWKDEGGLNSLRGALLSLYHSKKAILPNLNEGQTEKEFIQPVLDLLGYGDSYIVQTSAKIAKQTTHPDYALYPDPATKDKAYRKRKGVDYSQCIGIADAKHWDRDLDLSKTDSKDTLTNVNPSFQIVGYLTATQRRWGILTNGRLWRLYSTKSRVPLRDSYQVDLVQILEEGTEEQLKWFILFFGKKSLLLSVDNKSLLDRVLEGSADYAIELEAHIKERAFEVVEHLCRGFAASFMPEQLTENALDEIYDSSLILLYRLLFVFYAEARELLPLTTNTSYRDNYSLSRLAQSIHQTTSKGQELNTSSTEYYQKIADLFHLIATGDAGVGIPEYNGGLFDPDEHPFLEQHGIADAFLAPAVQRLARVPDKKLQEEVAVDYNTLTERHLGSIYEGLLEFKSRIAPCDLVVVKEKGAVKYAPAKDSPGKKVELKKGELYLANDKGERKATGSYYTPEHIVDYIVENTLDPLVKEAQQQVKALKPDVDASVDKWEKLKEQRQGHEPVEKYDREISKERERLLGPYLSLKVLDPAMGSGHFLARATNFLAEAIATDPWVESPGGFTDGSDLVYYRRRVVESCIYGVDLNPLAVELAKLTLWLTTMAKSKPLSFLNHHLRVGNSLIGARVSDLDEVPKAKKKRGKPFDFSRAPVQLGLFQEALNKKLYDLLQNRALIAQLPTETLEDVRNKETWEADFQHNMERFRTLADVWASTYFDNNVDWDQYNALVENLQSSELAWDKLAQKKYMQNARRLAEYYRFFHWELEFPEVFYNENGERKSHAGFDAIIGNPPYDVIAEKEQGVDVGPYKDFYEDCGYLRPALGGKLNYYRLFSALSIRLVRQDGLHGFIVPMALIGDAQAEPLRRYLLTSTQLLLVDAFPQKDDPNNRVFQDAKLPTCVYVLQKQNPAKPFSLRIHPGKYVENATPQVAITREDLELLDPQGLSIPSAPGSTAKHIALGIALAKRCLGHRFGEIASSQQGEVNLTTHAAFLSETLVGPEVLRGAHVGRYEFNSKPKQGTPVYVRIEKFLQGRGHDSKAFDHQERRIGYQRGSAIDNWRRIIACVIEPGNYCSDTINYIVRPKADFYFVLGLLNSNLFEWRFRLTSTNNHVNSYEVDALPQWAIRWTTPQQQLQDLFEKGKKLYGEFLETGDIVKVISFVQQRLPRKQDGSGDVEHEQSDVVHALVSFLAEEMTRLMDKKRAIIGGFLTWLEKEILGGSVEDQKNKTKIRGFHEGTFEGLLDTLKRNGAVPDPCPSQMRQTIETEFYTAMNTLSKLKARIEATDKLIDQIVYKLYGLTDEETAIVET